MPLLPLPASKLAFPALVLGLVSILTVQPSAAQTGLWATHSHDAQHTGVSSVGAQPFNKIHWQTPVDLAPPTGEIFIHYGSPLVTAANTVIVPVKTGTDSFRVEAHNGATGKLLWHTGHRLPVAPICEFLARPGPHALPGRQAFDSRYCWPRHGAKSPDLAKGNVSSLYFYGEENYLGGS